MLSHYDAASSAVTHRAVNACLTPLYAVEGMHVVTVEGLGVKRVVSGNGDGLHPVQRALAHAHGSQCGFCTPGFVMSMYALLRSKVGVYLSKNVFNCCAIFTAVASCHPSPSPVHLPSTHLHNFCSWTQNKRDSERGEST